MEVRAALDFCRVERQVLCRVRLAREFERLVSLSRAIPSPAVDFGFAQILAVLGWLLGPVLQDLLRRALAAMPPTLRGGGKSPEHCSTTTLQCVHCSELTRVRSWRVARGATGPPAERQFA